MTGSIVYNIIKEAGLLVPGLKSPPLFQSLYRKDETREKNSHGSTRGTSGLFTFCSLFRGFLRPGIIGDFFFSSGFLGSERFQNGN
ncbi:MAG TPA: hypothetical protein PK008_13240, partial [Aminivibrio sp.]|nr:hypothetical protein [Aminivibrio sp.]